MKRRVPSLISAALLLGANCCVALRVIPAGKNFCSGTGIHIPAVTQFVFAFGPALLIAMGLLSAYVMVMGDCKPALGRIREPLAILALLMSLCAGASLFLPRYCLREIINPSAREPAPPAITETEPVDNEP